MCYIVENPDASKVCIFSENMKGWHLVYEDDAHSLHYYYVQVNEFERFLGCLQLISLMKTYVGMEQAKPLISQSAFHTNHMFCTNHN